MRRKISIIVLLIALLLLSTAVVNSFMSDGFQLNWWTVDGGGGVSTGGEFLLQGTAGQHDAGDLQGGRFTLAGGFWQPLDREPVLEKLMLPLVIG
jgi:hypothetical protein